jgi:hypothetical protein
MNLDKNIMDGKFDLLYADLRMGKRLGGAERDDNRSADKH